MATYLENLVAARNGAAAALAAASARTDSPENIAKLLSMLRELNDAIDDAANRDATTGELGGFEIESRDAL